MVFNGGGFYEEKFSLLQFQAGTAFHQFGKLNPPINRKQP